MFSEDFLIGLLRARRITVLTGAGISAESGIATFRDAQTGLWERYDPALLASAEGYKEDKSLVWGWYEWRRAQVLKAKPNPGHLALVELERFVDELTVVTQNVDDLHERAGSKGVIHLHGSLHHPKCFSCNEPHEFANTIPNIAIEGERLEPPRCDYCGGSIRPGVVWFGELVPEEAWQQAEDAVIDSDVLLSIGTSSLVRPASMLPDIAIVHGAKIVQINPDPTPLDSKAHYNFRGKAGEILPTLVKALSDLI